MRLTEDEAALAREAVACKHWDLLPGMLMDQRGLRVRYEDGALRELFAGDLPVFADCATMGCLLALVRMAWNKPAAYVRRCGQRWGDAARLWGVYGLDEHLHELADGTVATSEEAALVAALKAAP